MARVKSQKSQKRRKTFVRFLPIYILMLPGLIYLFINNYMPLPGLVNCIQTVQCRKRHLRKSMGRTEKL